MMCVIHRSALSGSALLRRGVAVGAGQDHAVGDRRLAQMRLGLQLNLSKAELIFWMGDTLNQDGERNVFLSS